MMQKNAFYQAVVGGIRFDGVLSADGPTIEAHSVVTNRPAGGVALAVSGLRRFLPSEFDRGPGPWGWYIVKYRSEARVLLDGFTAEHVQRMRPGVRAADDRRAGQPWRRGSSLLRVAGLGQPGAVGRKAPAHGPAHVPF